MCNAMGPLEIPEEWIEDDMDFAALYMALQARYSEQELKEDGEQFRNLARHQQSWSPDISTAFVEAITRLVNCRRLELIDK